jgi:hypothetical protein
MIKRKIYTALNEEELKEIDNYIEEMMKKKKFHAGDFIESGFFGVRISDIFPDKVLFDVYRIVNCIEVKIKNDRNPKKR